MANNKQQQQQQQQQQQTQKKTEVKKTNAEEDTSNAMASSSSSSQAVPSDVYEFVSTPKHSSCSSGDENPIKSFDKSSVDDKSGTDSDTQMISSATNVTGTSSCAQQQKRTLGDQQDRNEDNLSQVDEDSKRKKRKDSEFPLSSSVAGTNAGTKESTTKPSLISGTNRVTSRIGTKVPGPASKTMGLINKGSNDRKSPCESPKMSKSPADSTDVDNEELTKSSSDSGPLKVPPLKIVIPQQQPTSQPTQQMQPQNPGNSNETQDQQGTNVQRVSNKGPASRNISSTSSSSLPYVLNASSNSNDSNSNDKQESLDIASSNVAGRSQSPMTESNKSMNEDGKQVGGKSKEPRVLRSSQRSGKDSKDDRSSNNSSPQLPVSSTPSPAAHNSGDSSSAGTESEGNGQQGMNVTSSTTPSTSNQMPTTSNSATISSQQQTQNQQNQPQPSSSSSSQTSVDLHPRKRKIKPSSNKEQPSSSTNSANTMVTSSSSGIDTKDSNSKDGSEKAQESTHPHDQPFTNCYQMYIDLRKQIDQRHRNLQPIEPRPLKGLEDYLMNRRTYSLQGKAQMEPNLIIPPLLPNQMKETFFEQEKERHKLKMRHIVEKEKLVLSKEQEILRVHCKAAQIQANQNQPFSFCTILKDDEVYNQILTSENEERYNNRSFFKELKDLDDKWDKIKEAIIIRHTNEAESLHAVQKMDWGWKLKEYLLCDYKATPEIEELHVPMVDVSDEYTTPSIKN